MAWAKVCDTLHSHPKARRAGLPALGLHLLALSYCGAYLTDGFVDQGWLDERLRGRERRLPEQLVSAGIWEVVEGGYLVHDWLDFNQSRAEIEQRRRDRAEAGRKGGLAKAAGPSNGVASA